MNEFEEEVEHERQADLLESDVVEDTPQEEQGLWPGDTGTLAPELREVLVKLLRGPYLSSTGADEKSWLALRENESEIRSRLHDMYLELVIDEHTGYVFSKNVELIDMTVPHLMRKQTLTNAQTMLLVRARQLQLRASAQNLVAYLDFEEIKEFLRPWLKMNGVQDEAKLNDRCRSAISGLVKNSILKEVEKDTRYQVQEIVAGLLPAETAKRYKEAYEDFMAKRGITFDFDTATKSSVDSDLGVNNV